MDTSLTLSSSAALFGAMLVLALVPSLSVITVTARSAAFGFIHGASTAMGVVAGDILFILIAIIGLGVIAESMEGLLSILKYISGTYLIWLGVQFWRSKFEIREVGSNSTTSLATSFSAGFLLTIGDQKAILFYLVFFPAFVDLSKLTFTDAAIILIIATLSVGGAKLAYAYMADKASQLLTHEVHRVMSVLASLIMVTVGLLLILKP
jgi:threonine/homoserine/homoserine lactone efflux protein